MPRSHRSALIAALLVTSCGARPEAQDTTTPVEVAASPVEVAPALPRCPKVGRAARMWSGFAVDVPIEQMGAALDEIAPIEEALTQVFCEPKLPECGPVQIHIIELADAEALQARVEIGGVRARAQLEMVREQDKWRVVAPPANELRAICR